MKSKKLAFGNPPHLNIDARRFAHHQIRGVVAGDKHRLPQLLLTPLSLFQKPTELHDRRLFLFGQARR